MTTNLQLHRFPANCDKFKDDLRESVLLNIYMFPDSTPQISTDAESAPGSRNL
jgi:hypothetical protein